MPRSPNGKCIDCRKTVWLGRGSLPNPVCRPCRRARQAARSCSWCSTTLRVSQKRYCSRKCSGAADSARRLAQRGLAATAKSRRVDRDSKTDGLGAKARLKLLAKWKRQARTCAYCPAPATTIDHVIPLVRGGTNYEGNLVPACRPCNSRKNARLIIEFRLGRRAGYRSAPMRVRTKRETKAPVLVTHDCIVCSASFTTKSESPRRKTCGADHCRREWTGRSARDAYRRKAGLTVDPSRPTAYWARLGNAA